MISQQMLGDVYKILNASFEKNEAMKNTGMRGLIIDFWDTKNKNIKISVTSSTNLKSTKALLEVNVCVEDESRPGLFFRLGDCNQFWPEWVKNLQSTIDSGARIHWYTEDDVISYANNICEFFKK